MTMRMTSGEQKLACVGEQIALVQSGEQDFIGCPYCGERNRAPNMCCELLKQAVKALLEAEQMARNLQICEQINERLN